MLLTMKSLVKWKIHLLLIFIVLLNSIRGEDISTSSQPNGNNTTSGQSGNNGSEAPTEDDDDDGTEIAIITVAVAIGIIALIFLILCICHYKYTVKYAPKPKAKKNQDPVNRMATHPSIPVTEQDFYDHVSHMKFHNFKGFYEEFSLLRKIEIKVADDYRQPKNIGKNRYLNKPLGQLSRVTLEGEEQYIFANYIPGTDSDKDYIITQNPLPETIKDFWAMVTQQNVHTIVMVGDVTEKNEPVCAPYFPTVDSDDIETPSGRISLHQTHTTCDYHVHTLHLTAPNKELRVIKHFQFISWPHVRFVPEVTTPFLSFLHVIEKHRKSDGLHGPIVVHGSTVADRAGIYTAVDSQIRRIEDQNDVNVFNHVSDLKERIHEGVKTLDEYIFIHDCLSEFILKRKIKNIPVDKLPGYIEKAAKSPVESQFLDEYTFLSSLSTNLKLDAGNQDYNRDKNRYSNIKPFDMNRVKLSKIPNKDGSDYINASWIDTYLRKKAFIAAQAPIVETIGDFWRMISETESWVIILLGQEIENGQLKVDRFWPMEGNVLEFENLTVKLLAVQPGVAVNVITRQIELFNKQTGVSKLIQFYQYLSWPSHKNTDSKSTESLVKLVHLADTWELKLKAKTVTVVTSSGIGRNGALIALRSIQEESEVEGSVNIFRTVQRLRQQRAALVQTREDYRLIYTTALQVSQQARRRTVLNESFSELTDPGVDILPNGFMISRNGSIVSKVQKSNAPSETDSKF